VPIKLQDSSLISGGI